MARHRFDGYDVQDRHRAVSAAMRFVAFQVVQHHLSDRSSAQYRTWLIEGYGPTEQDAIASLISNVDAFRE